MNFSLPKEKLITTMDLNDITVTKLKIEETEVYLMVGWLSDAFDMFLFLSDGNIYRGRFSTHRLLGLSNNLHWPKAEYFAKIRRCLSQPNQEYIYELKTGFFYWKRKLGSSVILEGFLPVEQVSKETIQFPDLLGILLALNKRLKKRVKDLQSKFVSLKKDFCQSLKDTEEFLDLKIEMEQSLNKRFLNIVAYKKAALEEYHTREDNYNPEKLTS